MLRRSLHGALRRDNRSSPKREHSRDKSIKAAKLEVDPKLFVLSRQ